MSTLNPVQLKAAMVHAVLMNNDNIFDSICLLLETVEHPGPCLKNLTDSLYMLGVDVRQVCSDYQRYMKLLRQSETPASEAEEEEPTQAKGIDYCRKGHYHIEDPDLERIAP